MTYVRFVLLFCIMATIAGCNDEKAEQQRLADIQKAEKLNDSILNQISSHWKFKIPSPSQGVADKLSGWNEWTAFMNEIEQKPSGSLSGYRQKAFNLVARSEDLSRNIPEFFNKPPVEARISVLQTRIKSLYTFINVEVIPEKEILALIDAIGHDTAELERQMDEMVRLSEIPKEQGEEEMLKALDTVRLANPDALPVQQEKTQPQTNLKNTQMPPPGHGAGMTEPH